MPFERPHDGKTWLPVDVAESDDAFDVWAELPGVDPSEIQITAQEATLTIAGEPQRSTSDRRWLARERAGHTFRRTIVLPMAVDADRASAHAEHGVIHLTLPKLQPGRRRIEIGASPRATAANPGTLGPPEGPGGPREITSETPDVAPGGVAGRITPDVNEDVVTEASDESFPASDPPAWTSTRA